MSANQTISQILASMAYDVSLEKFDSTNIHIIKRFILDHLGCAYAGVLVDSSQTITRSMMRFAGENAPCTVIGQSHKNSPTFTALINGTLAHAVEMDDDHREGTLHPGVAVIPAALAVAEWYGKSGKEFIEAVIAGYEVMIRIGAGFLGQTYYSGWHPTATCGVYGSAVAVGKLIGLDAEGLAVAMGIAGSTSSGLLEWQADGSWTKRFQAGNAAMNGIVAALLAKQKYTSPLTILEGDNGFYKAYSHQGIYDLNVIIKDLDQKFMAFDTSIKPYACCRFSQPIIDCTLDLVFKYDLKPSDIKDVLVKADKWAITILTEPQERKVKPLTVVDAQFSIPYAVAISIARRKALLDEFSTEAIVDPVILDVAQKVRWEEDPSCEDKYPKSYPSSVTIWTEDGRQLDSYIQYPKGDPENPVTDQELLDKFRQISSRYISRSDWIERIIKATLNLETCVNVQEFTELL